MACRLEALLKRVTNLWTP
jgi:hypothetical protein